MLFRIVNLDEEWIELRANESDMPWLRGVETFRVRFDSLQKSYEAKRDIVVPKLDAKEALYTLRLRIVNSDGLIYPGMYAKVEAKKELGEHLVVPASAVIHKGGRYYAFLKTEFEGEFEPVELQVRRLGQKYIVTKGLKEREEIVKSAMFMMDSDAQINGLY